MTDQEVWLLHITHRFGTDTTACASEDAAQRALYDYVCQWWGDNPADVPEAPPADQGAAIAMYFEGMEDREGYCIEQQHVRQ